MIWRHLDFSRALAFTVTALAVILYRMTVPTLVRLGYVRVLRRDLATSRRGTEESNGN